MNLTCCHSQLSLNRSSLRDGRQDG